jgi:hypothetical protein
VTVKNFEEFKNVIQNNIKNVEIISFDNDLGMDEGNNILPDGYSCLNWLIENDIYVKGIIVHSDNIIANEQIFGKAGNWHKFLVDEKIFNENDIFIMKRPAMSNLTNTYKKRETN